MSNKTYITDDCNLNDSSIAASSKAVKTAYDAATAAQTAASNAQTAAELAQTTANSKVSSVNGKTGDVNVGTVVSVNGEMPDSYGNVAVTLSAFNSEGKLQFPNGTQMWIA